MYDSAPAYFSIAVRNDLDVTYPGRWIGHSGHVHWPPSLSNHNTLDFFDSSPLKSFVYQTPVDTLEYVTAWIVIDLADISSTPDNTERFRQFLVRRCPLCSDLRGRNFEQFL